MREIGGYIEFPQYSGFLLHEKAIALNSARNCLAYLIEAKDIKKIILPKFLCASIKQICEKYEIRVRYYSIDQNLLPNEIDCDDDEWMYLVNYYGQIGNEKIKKIQERYKKLIVDNVQAYFQMPLEGIDTIYTCRKYFGVSDGAFLYTNVSINRRLDQDRSSERMEHLLGRYEATANEYYATYLENEKRFENLPLKTMSKLTRNILSSIDYEKIKVIRERNFLFLDKKFRAINKFSLKIPEGAFMYPLYILGGDKIRKELQKKKIYIATLWPDVFENCNKSELEYSMAKDILPIPCDQRYNLKNMEFVSDAILNML